MQQRAGQGSVSVRLIAAKELSRSLSLSLYNQFASETSTLAMHNLRLAVPASNNPLTSPLGETSVRKMLRTAVARSNGKRNKELISVVQDGVSGLDKKSIDRMRASLTRVNKMDRMLVELERMVDEVYTQMVSNQNA